MEQNMSDSDTTPEPTPMTPPAGTPAAMSTREAAQLLASLRRPKEPAPVAAAPAPVEQPESPPAQAEDDAAPAEQATGETQEAEPAPEPAIEPPRSWSKEARERWSKLDHDTQQYLLDRDSQDSAAVRKAQNEAAEARKAIEAERTKVETARQQYETALPQLFQTLQAQQAGQFSDIKNMADVERMAAEDWPRYLQWDVAQKKMAAVQQEYVAAQQRQQEEHRQKFAEFAKREEALFAEKVPDMADPKKADVLRNAAKATLEHLGFSDDEMGRAWNSPGEFSLRDHRVQMLVIDATRWREAQAKAKTVAAKPVPPVQRPGVAKPAGAENQARLLTIAEKFGRTRGVEQLRAGAELIKARRPAGAR